MCRMTKLLRVCVIGAGAAGLTAARHLTSQLDMFDVSVFEQALLLVEHGSTTKTQGQTNVDLLFTPAFTETSGKNMELILMRVFGCKAWFKRRTSQCAVGI